MSDSTQNLDTISVAQSQKETTANALFDAASVATIFGRRASTCAALVFGYYGGRFGGTSVPNGTVTATASNTNYVVAHRTTLAVTVATSNTNWNDTATYGRMYKLTAGSSSITAYEDHRAGEFGISHPADAPPPFVVVTQSYSSSVTFDLSTYAAYATVIIDITLTGNITWNFSNGTDGQVIKMRVRQDGGGSRIWTSGAALRFSADITSIVLSTAASKLDYIGFEWNGTDSRADVLAMNKGY